MFASYVLRGARHIGDMFDGWLVTAIDPAALRLTLGEREEEYRLFDPKRDAPHGGTDD